MDESSRYEQQVREQHGPQPSWLYSERSWLSCRWTLANLERSCPVTGGRAAACLTNGSSLASAVAVSSFGANTRRRHPPQVRWEVQHAITAKSTFIHIFTADTIGHCSGTSGIAAVDSPVWDDARLQVCTNRDTNDYKGRWFTAHENLVILLPSALVGDGPSHRDTSFSASVGPAATFFRPPLECTAVLVLGTDVDDFSGGAT